MRRRYKRGCWVIGEKNGIEKERRERQEDDRRIYERRSVTYGK